MTESTRICRRILAAFAAFGATLTLANTANAVDLRDWGRKFPASERFVVLAQFSNQAVLDKETQLVWQRTPDSLRRGWVDADTRCMNASTGGRKGWRLPSRSEFMSLIDPAAPAPIMLPAGHPFTGVTGGESAYYWTSDPYRVASVPSAGSINSMFTVYITTGGVSYHQMSSAAAIGWCVRGSEG